MDQDGDTAELVGANIQRHRKQAGLTQEALSEKAGLSTAYISQVECGFRCISLRRLRRVARALQVPAGELLHGM